MSFTQVKSQLRVQGSMKREPSGKDNGRGGWESSRLASAGLRGTDEPGQWILDTDHCWSERWGGRDSKL